MKMFGYSQSEMSHLHLALKVAAESDCRQQVGAVVVKGGSVIATACNKSCNHPDVLEEKDIKYHATICAERRAIAQISDSKCKGAVIYVARIQRKTGGFGISKPCDRCQKVMKEKGIKRAIYIK